MSRITPPRSWRALTPRCPMWWARQLRRPRPRWTAAGFTYRTVGSGETVTDQTPAGGAIVPNNASIVLYLGAEKPDTPCTVPNVVGKTPSEANKALTNAGLIMKVAGATIRAAPGSVTAISQSAEAGTAAGGRQRGRRFSFGAQTTDWTDSAFSAFFARFPSTISGMLPAKTLLEYISDELTLIIGATSI